MGTFSKTHLSPPWDARQVLDAVEQWAYGCYLLRETGQVASGRLDGLLVPWTWGTKIRRGGMVGIEVKIHRSDFLRGMKNGQYDRYLETINGLYLATGPDVCKTREIPPQFGHLVCGRRRGYGPVCICRRRAKWHGREYPAEAVWKIVWDLFDQWRRKAREEAKDRWRIDRRASHVVGDAVAEFVRALQEKKGPTREFTHTTETQR